MKQAAGWAGSWLMLGARHLLPLSLRFTGVLYTPYKRTMGWSVRLQDWGGAGPWEAPKV